MIAMLFVMMMCHGTSISLNDGARGQTEVDLSFFPQCSNRDIQWDLGYFGLIAKLDRGLVQSVMEIRESPSTQQALLMMLCNQEKNAVAQLLLVEIYGWDDSANAKFPGFLGLEIPVGNRIDLTKDRASALRSYWERKIEMSE